MGVCLFAELSQNPADFASLQHPENFQLLSLRPVNSICIAFYKLVIQKPLSSSFSRGYSAPFAAASGWKIVPITCSTILNECAVDLHCLHFQLRYFN